MNAQVEMVGTGAGVGMRIARAEHISIEAEPEESAPPTRRACGKVRASYTLKSALRGCETELSLLEDHYLSVRSVRPQSLPIKYDVDLRFASPKPVRVREISWTWLIVTIGLVGLASGAIASAWSISAQPWTRSGFIAALVTLLVSVCTFLLFLRRTTESLQFKSLHGQATLVSVTGGIGSARGGKQFFVELIKDISAARSSRLQEKPQLLRDEMREHHRLREVGVFSEEEYEASKARILSAHA